MTIDRRTSLRTAAAVLLSAGIAVTAAVPARAAAGADAPVVAVPGASAPGAADLAAARAAVDAPAVLDRVGHFFARHGAPPNQAIGLTAAQEQRTAAAEAPRLSGATVPVFTIDAAFVRGTAGAPVATADFLASTVVAADGQAASVWTVRQDGAWRVVNIASGGDEAAYAAKAGSGGGGQAFREPQINAWYVLRGGRVLPLDDEARRSVGAAGVTLAAYQRLVHQRYADKLPGSAYDRSGEGGGFSPDANAGTGADAGAAVHHAAARPVAAAAPAARSAGLPGTALGLGLAGALGAAAVGAAAVRRRRRTGPTG